MDSPVEVSPEAAAAHAAATVVDLHNDLLTKLTHLPYDIAQEHAPATFYNPLRLDLDLPRIRRGGIDALGCLMFAGFRVDRGRRFWRQLACARRLRSSMRRSSRWCGAPRTSARPGRRGALPVSGRGGQLRHRRRHGKRRRAAGRGGVRFLGPLWERDSRAGTSCRTPPERDSGLTDAGRALVRSCNDAGLLLDVAHASKKTFWDMVETSRTPPFSSHSGAAGVHPHPRNLDDDQIRALAARAGSSG